MVRIYLASKMTGRTGEELVNQSRLVASLAETLGGITIFDPIAEEGVKDGQTPLQNTEEDLWKFWKRDKFLIREAHVVIDLTASMKSEGSAHEIGYARYALWTPVIRVWPNLPPNVAWFEDDYIAPHIWDALKLAKGRWGNPWKRLKWKAAIFNRCFLKFLWTRFVWFFNWI